MIASSCGYLCLTTAGEYGATLWKMPEYSRSSSVLEKLADLDGHEKKIKWYVIMSSYLIRANRQPYYA